MRILAAAGLLAALALSSCSSSGGGNTPTGTPNPTERFNNLVATAGPAEDAIGQWVGEHLNQGFVARCEDAVRPDDVGKVCAGLLAEHNGLLAYQLGPTFSNPDRLLILEQQDGAWKIAHEETYKGELTTIPWPLEVGAHVVVAVDSECLQVRDQPGLSGVPVDCLDNGTAVTVNAGPTDRDGFTWWKLEGRGWVAGDYLRYPLD